MSKPMVAVIFGSRSTEHDVSIITAIASIIKPLELSGKYDVLPVYIDKSGRWFADPKLKDIAIYTSGKLDAVLAKLKPLQIRLGGGLEISRGGKIGASYQKIDVVFPATHGTHGEDGELMGMLSLIDVPYVGCDMPASVVAMDKALAKLIAESEAMPTTKFIWFYDRDWKANRQEILAKLKGLKYPLFVKPVHLGSSIAISRVKDQKELINAVEVACHYDDKVLVEEAVSNLIEVTVPIIGNDQLTPAFVEEMLLKGEDFFSFDLKYMQGGKKGKAGDQGSQGYSHIPAKLPPKMYAQAEQLALNVYRLLGCKGIARVDLLIDKETQKVYFNEVNPLPGSLYAHNWQKKGISSIELVDRLVQLALEAYQKQNERNTVFDTNYLKQY